MLGENNVQMAITAALQVWCHSDKRSLQLFPPYANQQGDLLKRYCADLLGIMEGADLIALEVKEYDTEKNVLTRFDQDQWESALFFETQKVPIAYAYNAVSKLAYHKWPQPPDWPEQTLCQVKRSIPSQLESEQPKVQNHMSLLDWLNGSHSRDGAEFFGGFHGVLESTDDFTNGIMVLLYSTESEKLATFTADELKRVVELLRGQQNNLNEAQLNTLKVMLNASADKTSAWSKFQQKPSTFTRPGRKGP